MLQVKWTLVVCVFTYSTYMAAQFYPQFYTLLPTGFLLGLGAAPLWSAKCTYLTQLANRSQICFLDCFFICLRCACLK